MARYLTHANQILNSELSHCTKGDLERLYGRLLYASHIVRPGKAFLMRLYLLKECKKHVRQTIDLSHNRTTVAAALMDLRWWSAHFVRLNRLSFKVALGWLPHVEVWTDASGTLGIGGFSRQRFFSVPWSLLPGPHLKGEQDIHWRELLAVVAACQLWGAYWRGHAVHLFIDNSVAEAAVRRRWSGCGDLAPMVRWLATKEQDQGFTFVTHLIKSEENPLADSLSRLDTSIFSQ